MKERTLVLLKPNVFPQGLPVPREEEQLEWLKRASPSCREILRRYEEAGLRIITCKALIMQEEDFLALYGAHRERPFFHLLEEAYLLKWQMAVCYEGEGAIRMVRELNGHRNPLEALPGTIRADFGDTAPRSDGFSSPNNAVHGSEDQEAAPGEIKIFFPDL